MVPGQEWNQCKPGYFRCVIPEKAGRITGVSGGEVMGQLLHVYPGGYQLYAEQGKQVGKYNIEYERNYSLPWLGKLY